MAMRRLAIGSTKAPPAVAVKLGLTCDCGSDQVFAVAPGQEADRAAGLFSLTPGKRPQAWCEACWIKAHRGRLG